MLKPYHSKDSPTACKPVNTVTPMTPESGTPSEEEMVRIRSMKLQNSDVLSNLDRKLSHLSEERVVVKRLVEEFSDPFPDVPGRITAACYDVDVGAAQPVKQHLY